MNAIGSQQDIVNAQVYHRAGVEAEYRARTLTRMEAVALLKYQPAFAQKDVLDVGVGTGRTSVYLTPLSRRYESIDYSPVMVEYLRTTMPELSVRLADMRRVSDFDDGTFDFVFASNNVIDAVGHTDRLLTLREFHRLLRPGGTLMFSSHNRHYIHASRGPKLGISRNPIHQLGLIYEWLHQMMNHFRIKPLRSFTEGYALLNDEGHDYACLHYYIDQIEQRRQLAEQGFDGVEVFDDQGCLLAASNFASRSPHLMYAAKRVALH